MPNKTIAELKSIMEANAQKTTKGSITPQDVFQTMEWLTDTLNEMVGGNAENISRLIRDFGQFEAVTTKTLSVGTSNKYINLSGIVTSNNAYSMTNRIQLAKGHLYLFQIANAIDSNVSLISRYSTETETVAINYTYTYDGQGRIATATADYDSSVQYDYTYTEDEQGNVSTKITQHWDGAEVAYLPSTHQVTGVHYYPLFSSASEGTPTKGYVPFVAPEDMEVVISCKTADATKSYLEAKYGVFYSLVNSLANKREMQNELAGLHESIDDLNDKVGNLSYGDQNYCVAEYDVNIAAPEASHTYGSRTFANNWHLYLVDCTATPNDNGKIVPVGELQRGNILRFTNGKFAPVVAITATQAAECDVELYLDAAHTNKYCNAGEFDAEVFYNTHGMAKLYDANGDEVRVLRPWETVDTKYFIGISRDADIYVLDGQVGDSGKIWKGIFGAPMTWDGIDVTPYKLEPTLMPLGAVTEISNKPRFMYFDFNTRQTNCEGSKGADNLITWWDGETVNKTYPKVNQGEVDSMTHASSMNPTTTNPYPWAEGGFLTLDAYIISQEVVYGTNDIHAANKFGSGISANDACADEANYLANGGFRYKVHGTDTWKYAAINGKADIYNASHAKYDVYQLLNQQYPKEEVCESPLVASFAKELNIAADTAFEVYGGSYKYQNIAAIGGVTPKTILEGGMNARLYRFFTGTIDAKDLEGNNTTYDVEFCQRMSLYGGVRLAGDIYIAYGGGLELIGLCTDATAGSSGNISQAYIQPNQKLWHNDSTVSKNNAGKWAFEDTYIKMGEVTGGSGYIVRRLKATPFVTQSGGNLHTHHCGYWNGTNYWSTTLNQRVRQMKRFGGIANFTYCSPRFVSCILTVSYTSQYLGCSAQCLLQVDAVPQRSE